MKVKLLNKKTIAHQTMEFCFEKPDNIKFVAGQHFSLKLINPRYIDEGGLERIFSTVSLPNDFTLCFATRIRNSAFKENLKNLNIGDEVKIDGPSGQMILPQNTEKYIVFIAGGIGIAPFMSMIRAKIQNNLPYKIYLFYSNRRPEDAAYLNELLKYARSGQINLIATMTQIKNSKIIWEGETAYINEKMIKKYLNQDQIQNSIFYIAGPPQFVSAMFEMLYNLNIENIKSENFDGY